MRLDEPAWWYRAPAERHRHEPAAAGARSTAGSPGSATCARTPYRSRLPVICVGNFTAGGTGKTPLAIHLCERLKAAGHEPVALTRGYGGRLAGPYWVNAKTDTARDVGDEALLLARAAPTLVARDRRAGARAIETGPHPVTVIVMDDGLQNPRLAKDLTIAVVDGGRGLGNGLVMPAGPLRAPLEFPARADRCDRRQRAHGGRETRPRRNGCGIALPARCCARAWFRPRTPTGSRVRGVVAWAGIGAPERFFAMLQALGAEVLETVAFRDHQWLSEADAGRLLQLAHRHSATLVTTEKDMARLTGSSGVLAELARPRARCPSNSRFAESDSGTAHVAGRYGPQGAAGVAGGGLAGGCAP